MQSKFINHLFSIVSADISMLIHLNALHFSQNVHTVANLCIITVQGVYDQARIYCGMLQYPIVMIE